MYSSDGPSFDYSGGGNFNVVSFFSVFKCKPLMGRAGDKQVPKTVILPMFLLFDYSGGGREVLSRLS